MTNKVNEPREEYVRLLPFVEKNRAAVAGQRAVKDASTKFLAPLASMCCITTDDGIIKKAVITPEGQADYNKYLANAYFYGATGRTVEGLSGLIHSKAPSIKLDPSIEFLKENADGKGMSLSRLAATGTNEGFITPWSGFLVARPDNPASATVAQIEAANIRPKILHYKFENILSWDYEVINNVEALSFLVLQEQVTNREGFKITCAKQYRVLEIIDGIYHQSLYNESCEVVKEVSPVIVNGEPGREIPFYWVEVCDEDKAVIDDLVDANFQHYNISADYGGKLHYSSFIIYTETGAQEGKNLLIGNGVKWSNNSPDAEFGILQPDGQADSHRLALKDAEERMAALGAEQLKPRISSAESAEAKGLDQVAQNSTTANVAITVSSALTKALNFASKWQGGGDKSFIALNTDYNPTGMNPQLLTALMAAVQGESISQRTFYENMQKGEIANPERSFEDEQKLISQENSEL